MAPESEINCFKEFDLCNKLDSIKFNWESEKSRSAQLTDVVELIELIEVVELTEIVKRIGTINPMIIEHLTARTCLARLLH